MQKKIFIWFVLIVVIPSSIIFFLLNHYFLSYSINKQIRTTTQLMEEMRKNLDTKLLHYQQLTMQFYLNNQAMEEIQSETPVLECDAVKNQLESFVNANRLITSAYIFTEKGYIYSGHGLQHMENIHKVYQEKLLEQEGRIMWTVTYPMVSNFGLEDRYFFGARHIREAQEPVASLYLGFNTIFFDELFHLTPFIGDPDITLFNNEGIIIASSNHSRKITLLTEELKKIQLTTEPYHRETPDGGEEIIISSGSTVSDWNIAIILSPREISTELNLLRNIMYISLALYLIFFLYLSFIISRKLSSPLKHLTTAINQVGSDTLDIQVEENHINEIRQLSMSFNNMMHRVRELLKKVTMEEQEKRKAYIQTLQLQLTPHFIYNSLNTIAWMARINGQKNIATVSKALIAYLRSVSDMDSEFITLKKEIELLEEYTVIQKFRYSTFTIAYQIPENMLQLQIHKFMLINLVENSIIHGFSEINYPGIVTITADAQNEILTLTVSDNGSGFPPDVPTHFSETFSEGRYEEDPEHHLNHTDSSTEAGNSRRTHTGLLNIMNRLRLFHGSSAKLSVAENPQGGTEITIYMPIINTP